MHSYSNIVITGGTKGIGRFIAESFLRKGASVVICSRNVHDVDTACREMSVLGGSVFGVACDISSSEGVQTLREFTVSHMKTVDVLINAAGVIGEVGAFSTSTITKWQEAITINVLGTVGVTHSFLNDMISCNHGVIINFAGAGVGSKKPLVNLSSYYTSKTAITGFTEVLAKELQESSIRVNCIAPGAINTSITDYILSQGRDKVGADMYDRTLAQKEQGGDSMEKIFDLIAFLASDESVGVSGKLLSSKWDTKEVIKTATVDNDLFTLRRIDNELFYGK